MKHMYRITMFALLLFVVTGFVAKQHTAHGQVPTPTLAPVPTGLPSLEPLPSGLPSLEPLPSGLPSLEPLPSGLPSLEPLPSGIPTQPPAPGGSAFIIGFVTDAEEEPMQGVTVTLDGASSSSSVTTDEDGLFEFRNLAAGDYTLTCEKEGFETYTEDISLGEGEVKNVEVVLEEVVKGSISGYIVDIKGDPVANARIKLKGIKTGYLSNAASDADGFFEFEDLEADTYVLVVKKKGYKKARKTLTLEDGESTEEEILLKKSSKRIIKVSAR